MISEQWINLFGDHTTLIFESVGDEGQWAETLKKLVEDLHARFGILAVGQMHTFQQVGCEIKGIQNQLASPSASPSAGPSASPSSNHSEHYLKHDVWLENLVGWLEKLVDSKAEAFISSDDVVDLNEYKRSKFNQKWTYHFGVAHAVGGYIAVRGSSGLRLALQRDEGQGAFTNEELHYLNLLRPQLKTAAKLHMELLDKNRPGDNVPYLKFTSSPALVCDHSGHIVEINSAALALIEKHSVARIQAGKILFESPIQKKLCKAMNQDLYNPTNPAQEVQITLDKDCAGKWVVLKVMPLRVTKKIFGKSQPGTHFLIRLAEPVNIQPWHYELLKDTYDLTKAETDICLKLCQGMCLDSVAQAKNRSLATIRTQLKSIFAKTGVSQQSQLVSLVLQRHF